MKALLKSTLVIAAAAVAFASCQTEEINAPAEGKTVNFLAVSNDAKAAFSTPDGNTYPVLWTANDTKAKVCLNYGNGSDATVTPAEDFTSATISCPNLKDDETGSYTFYAVSPSSAWVSFNSSYKSENINVPTAQTPTATSVDEAAMILVGQTETLTEFPTDYVPMPFEHFTAYGLLSFANLNLDGATVTSVEISSSEDIAGRWYYYPEDGSVSANSGAKAITINTTATENIWFAIAPANLTGKYVKFVVNTSKGAFTREFQSFTKGNFESGKIAKFTVDMSGIAAVEGTKYVLVKDVSELTSGSEVIIAALKSDFAMSSTQNGNNRGQAGVTKDETTGDIIVAGDAVELFTLLAGSTTGTYSFLASKTPGYIYAAGGTGKNNYLKTKDSKDVTGSWNITIAADGTASIVCSDASVARNTLMYNTSAGLFSCYASGQAAVAIYKSNAPAPVVLPPTKIELTADMIYTNDPMQYVVGGSDTYGFKSNPDWFGDITSSQKEARTAKYGLPSNMWDGDDATCFNTNLDWGAVSTSWVQRSTNINPNREEKRFIQVSLPQPVDLMKIIFKSGDSQKLAEGYDILYSTDGINFSKFGETLTGNDYGKEFTVEGIDVNGMTAIRIQNTHADADWTYIESAFGIAELEVWDMCPRIIDPSKVTGVSITGTADINVGKSATLTATVKPETASNKAVAWTSSNTAVATVANGVVTAIATGSAIITATTIDGGYSATFTVNVTELPEITLTADMLSTNAPMTYYSNCNPDWPSNYDASEGREAKYGLAANALDGDIATSFHTNFDCWEYAGEAYGNWGWACRAGFNDSAAKHYITLNLGKTYSKGVKLSIVNSDKENLGSGLNIYTSTDASDFSLFTSFDNVAKNEEVKFDVNKEVMAIRFENKAGVDWTGIGNAMGLAEVKAWELQ